MTSAHQRVLILLLAAGLISGLCCSGQAAATPALKMTKIDPPNWWANMPKPMLLVRGEGLSGATFTFSDRALGIERIEISANGHWAFLWLAAAPANPETVALRAESHGQSTELPYTFAARRAADAGFAGFSSQDVMYLIMTDRFADGDLTNDGPLAANTASSKEAAAERAKPRGWHGGDLRGIAQHLDYLQQLGVTTVWITPVYENHRFDSYHGYGATDMYRVDEHYGLLSDLQALGAALHARHMKLVLDEVPNHVGPDHPWVADEPIPDWFHGTAANHLPGESNFAALLDPHAPLRDRINTTSGWFVGLLPDMNTENPAVAQYLRQNVIWWVEQSGADGIRIDTFPYIDRAFWKPYLGALRALYPRLTEVGEAKSTDPVFTSSYAGGVTRIGADTTLWTPFDFPLDGVLHHVFAEGGPLSDIAKVLAMDSLYPRPERLVTLLDNHDEPRFRSEVKSGTAMRLALGVLMTTRGLPQLYSGDELALFGGNDPDNRHDFPGGFVGGAHSAFTGEGLTAEERETHDWVSKLTMLRRAHPALSCGAEQILLASTNSLVYMRDARMATCISGERALIAIQRGERATLSIPTANTGMQGCASLHIDLGSTTAATHVTGDEIVLDLAGGEILVAHCE
jgi:glycosidase